MVAFVLQKDDDLRGAGGFHARSVLHGQCTVRTWYQRFDFEIVESDE
jgi:hypothetical protein